MRARRRPASRALAAAPQSLAHPRAVQSRGRPRAQWPPAPPHCAPGIRSRPFAARLVAVTGNASSHWLGGGVQVVHRGGYITAGGCKGPRVPYITRGSGEGDSRPILAKWSGLEDNKAGPRMSTAGLPGGGALGLSVTRGRGLRSQQVSGPGGASESRGSPGPQECSALGFPLF